MHICTTFSSLAYVRFIYVGNIQYYRNLVHDQVSETIFLLVFFVDSFVLFIALLDFFSVVVLVVLDVDFLRLVVLFAVVAMIDLVVFDGLTTVRFVVIVAAPGLFLLAD